MNKKNKKTIKKQFYLETAPQIPKTIAAKPPIHNKYGDAAAI